MEEDSGLGAVQTIQSQYQSSERVNRRRPRDTITLNTSLPQQESENMETDSANASFLVPTHDAASETDIGGPAAHTPTEEDVYDSDSSEEDFDEKTAALYLSPGVMAVIRRRGKRIRRLREQKRKQRKQLRRETSYNKIWRTNFRRSSKKQRGKKENQSGCYEKKQTKCKKRKKCWKIVKQN